MLHHVFVAPDGDRLGRLGPKSIRARDLAVVHFTASGSEDAVRSALREGRLPPASTDASAASVVADALAHLRDEPAALDFLRACTAPDGLRAFVDEWTFLAEGGAPRRLGANLWPSQAAYLDAVLAHPWTYVLKARQLGETTIACAHDGHHWRFGPQNGRVHLFSLREDEAQDLLEQVAYGLDNLPEWLQLPIYRRTTRVLEGSAAPGDKRVIRAYTASRTTSRGATCTLAHLDEWANMPFPKKVMASVEPSVATGGSMVILTTEIGPESDTAAYWRQCIDGEGKHHPLFVSALARPDRDELWLEGQRRAMPKADFNREYPETWEQALEAAGERTFSSEDLDVCSAPGESFGVWESQREYEEHYAHLFGSPVKPRRKLSVGVDVGLKVDATVICVTDVTSDIVNVVGFERLVKPSVGEVQRAIEDTFARWPGSHIIIEDSGIGWPIRQGVNVPESRCHGVMTTGISKPRMIGALQFHIENHLLRYDAYACPELDRELRGYTTPDLHITTDCVMALAFAIHGAEHALQESAGRILGVIHV